MERLRPLLAEFIGTFILIFVGAGAICTDGFTVGGVGLVGIALAHGLAIFIGVSIFSYISGAHFNPAVTIGVLLAKKIDAARAVGYLIAQLLGATVAAFVLRLIFTMDIWGPVYLGTPAVSDSIGAGKGILIEAFLTMFLVHVVLATAVDERGPKAIFPFSIGLTITMGILVGGPLTGGALNPARAFGPALASGFWANQYVYWIGPILGGIVAALVYNKFFAKKT
ncbi:MAG: MIP family channel protein [candidate division Zixibacteria bacterium]|nr:MIP family channel protein [candidate division Zixibacteria bacterium]